MAVVLWATWQGVQVSTLLHRVGDVLDNRFEVTNVKQGGMGQVFVCKDLSAGHESLVALKTFTADPRGKAYPALRDRFLREAEAWFRIGRVHDDVDWFYLGLRGTLLIAGRPYLSMNYCPGGSLRDRLAEGPLPLDEALYVATQVLLGLWIIDDLHGLIHRDLKPENILFTKQGFAVISDLGIAKFAEGIEIPSEVPTSLTTLTQHGSFVGTLPYAAPEQLIGSCRIDSGVDIWAFGVVLYEMLIGERPFAENTIDELVEGILGGEAPALGRIRKRWGKALCKVIEKCLRKARADRYSTFRDLISDWDDVIRLRSSPPQKGFLGIDRRCFVDDERVEHEWLGIFPDRKEAEEVEVRYNQSSLNRSAMASDLRRIGKPAAALESCRIVLDTQVNGKTNLDRLLAGELDDTFPMVAWKEASTTELKKWYVIPPRSVAEGTLYVAMCSYVDLVESLRSDPSRAQEAKTRLAELTRLCDRIVAAGYASEDLLVMCAEGFVLAARSGDALKLLSRLQAQNPRNAKIATIYWVAALGALKPDELRELGVTLLKAQKDREEFQSKTLCTRICGYFGAFPEMEEYSRQALALGPNNLYVLHCLAVALFEQGKEVEARGVFMEMYRLDPGDQLTARISRYFNPASFE